MHFWEIIQRFIGLYIYHGYFSRNKRDGKWIGDCQAAISSNDFLTNNHPMMSMLILSRFGKDGFVFRVTMGISMEASLLILMLMVSVFLKGN